jgi:alcohol sulfotransferase
MNENVGLPGIIDYLNLWAREADRVQDLLVIRYEDMRKQPDFVLRQVMEFMNGVPANDEAIAEAVEYSSVENMRKLEEKSVFWLAGSRMKPGKKGDPNSYKVRRAKVGGYRDYFDDAQAAEIDELVAKRLSPTYGYESPEPSSPESDRAAAG